MEYIRIAGTGDIAPGQIIPVEAGGEKLLLAQVGSDYFAAQRKCPHLGFNLCRGSLDGGAVVCPLHKAKFDLASGKIERDPKLLFIKMTVKNDLKTYPVRIEGDAVLVGV
ncbi:MAG: Rieske 2Fe-2S domain-containing protein [Sphingomonadaceae bacterium]|nr:Rieske 2Fe-2S domain-containing protein [Sphingomonadaceae bacterium]